MAERDIKRAVRLAVGAHPDRVVLWLHVGGAIVNWVQCPKCVTLIDAHKHAKGARLDAGLGTSTGDLVGLTRGGRFFQIEVKRADTHETDGQIRRRQLINRMGGFAAVARSPEDAIAFLAACEGGECAPADPANPVEPLLAGATAPSGDPL